MPLALDSEEYMGWQLRHCVCNSLPPPSWKYTLQQWTS